MGKSKDLSDFDKGINCNKEEPEEELEPGCNMEEGKSAEGMPCSG